jgi:hypothetical protein
VKYVKSRLVSPTSHPRHLSCRALTRRVRRSLAWSVAAYGALQLGLALAVDQWLPAVRDPEFAVREARLVGHIRRTPDAPLLLMLGSSRTELALQAGRLSDAAAGGKAVVFNFGMPGCGPLMQLVCLRRLLDKGICPDKLFVEVMPPMLSWEQGAPIEERMLDGSRLSAREAAGLWPYFEQPRRLLWKWGLAQCLAGYCRRAAWCRALSFGVSEPGTDPRAPDYLMDSHGWQQRLATVDAEQRSALTRLARDQYDGALLHFEVAPQAQRALLDLLALCRSEGVEVTLVLMPEGTAFRALYPPEANDRLEQFLVELCREEHAKLVDARYWVDDGDFTDSHHVLAHGAEVFSNRFQAEVLRPTLAGQDAEPSKALWLR